MRVVAVVLVVACFMHAAAVPTAPNHPQLNSVATKLFSSAYKHRLEAEAAERLAPVHESVPVRAPKIKKHVAVAPPVQHVAIATSNVTHHGNNSHIHSVPNGTPLPIDISTSTGDVLVRQGRCRNHCRPEQATTALSSLFWSSHASLALPVLISLSADAPQVVASVQAIELEGESTIARALIPSEGTSAASTSAVGAADGFGIRHVCRSRGQSYLHITITSSLPGYDPIHLYSRVACAVDYDNCEGVECGEHGTCVDGSCFCHSGFTGAQCTISTLPDCPNGCSGNGISCTVENNAARCVCRAGYAGADCGTFVGCAALDHCSGHGQCVAGSACGCDFGWTGRACSEAVEGDMTCASLHYCKGHGKCVREKDAFVCECDAGFKGADCGTVDQTCPAACSGHGICVEGTCQCNFGFKGDDCSEAFSPCGGCIHGTCSESIESATPHCECHPGFTGPHCSVYDPSTDVCKNTGFCSGHGRCPLPGSAECECNSGFQGDQCERTIPQGCVAYCNGHGSCDVLTDSCQCNSAWTGESCSESLCPSSNGTVCSNKGACVTDSSTSAMVCNCATDFFGASCQNTVCKANTTCNSHGKCRKSSGLWHTLCECEEGWTGPFCSKQRSAHMALVAHSKQDNSNNENNNANEVSDDLDDYLNVLS